MFACETKMRSCIYQSLLVLSSAGVELRERLPVLLKPRTSITEQKLREFIHFMQCFSKSSYETVLTEIASRCSIHQCSVFGHVLMLVSVYLFCHIGKQVLVFLGLHPYCIYKQLTSFHSNFCFHLKFSLFFFFSD